MGAEISQVVKSDLEGSTLKELLSNEEFLQTVREAVPMLDEKVYRTLREILNPKSTKRRSKGNKQPGSTSKESPLPQDAVVGTSAQDDGPQEAASAGTNDTTSGAATALSTTSNAASPIVSALLGERALSIATLGENKRSQPLWEVKDDEVALSLEIADSFERWKADPSVFLRSNSSQAPTSLTEHYNYALSVRTSAVSNKILWRFITTAYYDVISARSHSDRYSITKEAVEFAVAVICKSSSYEREVVEANLIKWAKDGAKYRGLADKLGGTGCYFYYPQHLSEWIWTKYLPLSAYDKAAKLLNDFGILEKVQQSGAVELARSIETILKAPFQSTIPTQSPGQWILPMSQQQTADSAGGAAPRSKRKALLRKRRRLEIDIAQNPCLPTPRPREDLSARPVRDTRSSSFQSDNFAATPSTTPSQSIDSTLANAQDPNQLGSIQPETTPSGQELSIGLQLLQRDQQMVPYSAKQATVDTGAFLQVCEPRLQLQLSVQRKVADTAKSIWFATKGDTRALKRLFSERLASPAEVSNSRGLSLLGWALYAGMWNYHTAQFLVVECNAPVDDWSYDHAWEFAYRNCCDGTELKGLECIMLNPNVFRDWFEEQQFPEVHKIVLGRSSSKLLMTELDDNPFAVYATDAKGRTALSWATARAQLGDMRLLIARGSLPDTMDINGRSILLNAVDSSNNEGLRIILEAGANPNPVVPEGLFRSSPLIAAGIGSKLEMIKLLIEFGAEIDATNPEGWTALQAVIKAQNVECANILLTRGADLGYISKNGHSALTAAITYNSHAVLKLLIDGYHTKHLKGLQLLPIVAGSADVKTMSILGASALKQTLLNGHDFAVGYEILQSRTDYDERLSNAFNELLSVAGPKRK